VVVVVVVVKMLWVGMTGGHSAPS